MVPMVLIGIGAGAATALLFASVASGAVISILLFYLAPLPILIAAVGWSHWAALIALAATVLVAIGAYGMPAGMAIKVTGLGFVNGFFPIGWIVVAAISCAMRRASLA